MSLADSVPETEENVSGAMVSKKEMPTASRTGRSLTGRTSMRTVTGVGDVSPPSSRATIEKAGSTPEALGIGVQ